MKYYEVDFKIEVAQELMGDVCDVLSALAGEAGFETFQETEIGLKGYVQQTLFLPTVLDGLIEAFPFPEAHISYQVAEAEDRDWNEQWEQEGFAPIVVGKRCVVHDGRHFDGVSIGDYEIAVEIDAHLAFGTGTHETTKMMLEALLAHELTGKRVLDCGCGTGILGIAALKAGAAEVVGYDIDEWSAENARHNAIINRVEERFTSLLGDVSVLKQVDGQFDVVLANINRNILLADLPAFAANLKSDGILLLSGFYENDISLLTEAAKQENLVCDKLLTDSNWACLQFISK